MNALAITFSRNKIEFTIRQGYAFRGGKNPRIGAAIHRMFGGCLR